MKTNLLRKLKNKYRVQPVLTDNLLMLYYSVNGSNYMCYSSARDYQKQLIMQYINKNRTFLKLITTITHKKVL